jgi:hypothetical protein
MISNIAAIRGCVLSGWDLNLGDNFRLELFRTDFSTPAETAYSKCEVLFRSLSSVTIALTPIPGSALRVNASRRAPARTKSGCTLLPSAMPAQSKWQQKNT